MKHVFKLLQNVFVARLRPIGHPPPVSTKPSNYFYNN